MVRQLVLPLCMYISKIFFQVKIHYTVEGDTTVISTISANVATIDFIMRGLPGQPES